MVLLLVTLPVVSLEEVAEFVEFVEEAGRSEVTERVLGASRRHDICHCMSVADVGHRR